MTKKHLRRSKWIQIRKRDRCLASLFSLFY